jgi:hypothetical protein
LIDSHEALRVNLRALFISKSNKPILATNMELSQALMDEELMMQAEFIATLLEVPVEYVIAEFF